MKRYLVAAALIFALISPALAADYYVALRVGGGGCEVMTTAPTDTKKYKMMGKYSSEADAKAAMASLCRSGPRTSLLGPLLFRTMCLPGYSPETTLGLCS